MKQYFIGVDKRSKKVISGLLDLGATLMFYYHPITLKLNEKYKFYNGEWVLLTDVTTDDSTVKEVVNFLKTCDDLKYAIVRYQKST